MGNFFKWEYVISLFPKVLSALPVTLLIVLVATLIGTVLGLLIAGIRLEKIPVATLFCKIFVSFTRGTPIIVQLFIVFYGLPLLLGTVGIDLSSWNKIYFVYLTYGLNTAAFLSEIFRSAFLSVPAGQKDAAFGIGLTKAQMYRRILLPQAVRVALPSMGTTITGLLQDTSLAFTLGVMDVVGKVKSLGAITYRSLEGYFIAMVLFVVLSLLLEKGFAGLESYLAYDAEKRKKHPQIINSFSVTLGRLRNQQI